MKKKKNLKMFLKCLLLIAPFSMGSVQAAPISLTLSPPDKDLQSLVKGDMVTFIVGLSEATAISGYTLDIRYDDTELEFEGSEQLVPFFGGAFIPPFFLDPEITGGDAGSTGLGDSNSGRVAVLQTNNSESVESLFSLKFTVLDIVSDGLDDLVVGYLDVRADDINPTVGGNPLELNRDSVSAQVSNVPVPAAVWLFGSALIGLVNFSRKRKTV